MAIADRSSIRRVGGVLLTALTLGLAGSVQPASAQGLFQALFGGFQRRAPEPLPPQTSSFADPFGMFGDRGRRGEPAASATARSIACGPATAAISRCSATPARRRPNCANRSARPPRPWCSPAARSTPPSRKTARAMPTSTTPSPIATRSSNGCSCNGKDGLGLARVEPSGDPTLRPGDIVATDDGLATYNGSRTRPRSSRRSTRRRANGRAAWPR